MMPDRNHGLIFSRAFSKEESTWRYTRLAIVKLGLCFPANARNVSSLLTESLNSDRLDAPAPIHPSAMFAALSSTFSCTLLRNFPPPSQTGIIPRGGFGSTV